MMEFPTNLEQLDGMFGGIHFLHVSVGRWMVLSLILVFGIVVAWLSGWPARLVLRRVRATVPSLVWPAEFEHRLTTPIALILLTAIVRGGINLLMLQAPVGQFLHFSCTVIFVALATLLAIRLIGVGKEYLQARLTHGVGDRSKIRSIITRLTIPARILQFLLGLVGIAIVILQFRAVQELGMSLLASAGLAGVILGFAAQKTVGNLFAGMQLAFEEPIRIGDSVVLEGEFGEVEEIGLTYVVIKIWDLRRLIVPVSYFLEKPFQNWTKRTSEVIGPVMISADFSVPVPEMRQEFERILASTELWDRRTKVLQVTDLTPDRVELRALVSAADAGRLWDLRCLVREQLLAWIQSHDRKYVPVRRVEEVHRSSENAHPREGNHLATSAVDDLRR